MYVRTTLMLRLPAELHAHIVERAKKADMSLNQWVNLTLAAAILREADRITLTSTETHTYTL